MKHKVRTLGVIVLLGSLAILISCNKTENDRYFEGDIVGFVKLIDDEGKEIFDKSGVSVKVENTSFSAITNEEGLFRISNLPAGSYKLVYSKDGFGFRRIFNYQFIGGNLPAFVHEIVLFEQPNVHFENVKLSFDQDVVIITSDISEAKRFFTRFYFSSNPNVSDEVYDYFPGDYSYCCSKTTNFQQYMLRNQFPFKSGDRVYLVIYLINYYDQCYLDYEKEECLYNSLQKTSDVISIQLD